MKNLILAIATLLTLTFGVSSCKKESLNQPTSSLKLSHYLSIVDTLRYSLDSFDVGFEHIDSENLTLVKMDDDSIKMFRSTNKSGSITNYTSIITNFNITTISGSGTISLIEIGTGITNENDIFKDGTFLKIGSIGAYKYYTEQ